MNSQIPCKVYFASYVAALYQDVLGRAADPAGAEAWQQALANGEGRDRVARGVIRSREAYDRTLSEFYLDFLGRPVDAGGRDVWLARLQSGERTVSEVAAAILASEEYLLKQQE